MHYQISLQSMADKPVPIPWATGVDTLDSEASVWMYHMRQPMKHLFSEITITPFDSVLWSDLWFIRMINRDGKGILARLADFLKKRNINIVGMSSSTTDQGRDHAARVVVDCSGYDSKIDKNHDYRSTNASATMARLERELSLEFIQELRFLDKTTPSVSVYRNLALWRLYREMMKVSPKPRGKLLQIKGGAVALPKSELLQISETYSRRFGVSTEELGDPCALVSTSLFSDVIQLSMFFKDTGVASCVFSLDNRAGAIAAISGALASSGFNILGSRSWTTNHNRTSVLILVNGKNGSGDLLMKDRELLQEVNSLVFSSELARSYSPEMHSLNF